MKNYNKYFYISAVLLIAIFILSPFFTDIVFARPGGGHSFSGGGGGGYSGSGGGGGDGIGVLIYLLFNVLPPQVSIPLIIGIVVLRFYLNKKNTAENKTVVSSSSYVKRNYYNNIDSDIMKLKSVDPNFSKVLFLDFVSSVYNKYYTWAGTKDFVKLLPFLGENEIKEAKKISGNQKITEIVVGNMRISEINFLPDVIGIAADIESNYTLTIKGKSTRYSLTERWYFNRKNGVLSPEPGKMQKLACPACGAPADFTDAGICQSCGTKISAGEMQWFVKKHKILNLSVIKTSGLAHYEPERGTNLPTVYQAGLSAYFSQFAQMHNTDWNVWSLNFKEKVVKEYFLKIYDAWSKNNLNSVRNLLTDRLFDNFMFWINAYKSAGLVNKLDNVNIRKTEIVKFDFDRFYESITVRIFASAADYVVDKAGKIRGGSAKRPRSFSEYWTFIRRTGVEKDEYDYSTCPNCGAPADKIGQAGVCEYCGTKINNGDFSWVLAIITQDEVYKG